MKNKFKFLISGLLLVAFAFVLNTKSVNADSPEGLSMLMETVAEPIVICPGSGKSCVLWGLLYKGDGKPIEVPEPTGPANPN